MATRTHRYYDTSDDLYCRDDNPNSVFLNPRPRRIYITGHDGSTDDARPAGYTTSGFFRTQQGVELTYWEVDTANTSATATQSGALEPSAELFVDLGVRTSPPFRAVEPVSVGASSTRAPGTQPNLAGLWGLSPAGADPPSPVDVPTAVRPRS